MGGYHVHGKHRLCRSVNRERRCYLLQRQVLEKGFHLSKRWTGNAGFADFADGLRMIGVHAQLGRQVKGHVHAAQTLGQKMFESRVGIFYGVKTRVLTHGPKAATVHVGADAAGERVRAGES